MVINSSGVQVYANLSNTKQFCPSFVSAKITQRKQAVATIKIPGYKLRLLPGPSTVH